MNEDETSQSVPDYPEDKSTSDWLVPATRGVVGAVPIVGGLLGEVIGFVWTPNLQKRQAEWFQELGRQVEALSGSVRDIEERLKRDDVLTVVVQAARAATATHDEEKRAMLRTAVINSALEVEPDEEIRLIYVSLIDRLTSSHIHLLKLFTHPRETFTDKGETPPEFTMSSSVSQLIKAAFPNWEQDFYTRLATDLDQMGLAQAAGSLNTMMTADGAYQRRATPFGVRFLEFIQEPT